MECEQKSNSTKLKKNLFQSKKRKSSIFELIVCLSLSAFSDDTLQRQTKMKYNRSD